MQATLSVRMESNIKDQFDLFCEKVGINASVAVNMFARAVIREQKIPFDIVAPVDPFYSIENQERLLIAAERMEKYGGTKHDVIKTN